MAAKTLKKAGSGQKRGKMPVKTSINLAIKDENAIKPQTAIPAVIIICLLAALFGKFLVADRLIAASQASSQVSAARADLSAAYAALDQYSDVEEVYAHYTWSGMTQEEKTRTDRTEVMQLVKMAMDEGFTLTSWSVSQNMMVLKMTGSSLSELNRLSMLLEQEPIVDQCVMTAADKSGKNDVPKEVAASFTIYLHSEDVEQS